MLRRINLFAFLSLLATSAFAGTFSGGGGAPEAGSNNYIQNRDTLQTGATAYPQLMLTEQIGLSTAPYETEKIHTYMTNNATLNRLSLNTNDIFWTSDLWKIYVQYLSGGYGLKSSITLEGTAGGDTKILVHDAAGLQTQEFGLANGTFSPGRRLSGSVDSQGNSINFYSSIGAVSFTVSGSTVITHPDQPKIADNGWLYRIVAATAAAQVQLETNSASSGLINGRLRRVCKVDASTNTVTIGGPITMYNPVTLSYINECVDYYNLGSGGVDDGIWHPIGILRSTSTPSNTSGSSYWVGTATSDLNASNYGLFGVSTNSWTTTLIGGVTYYWQGLPTKTDTATYVFTVTAGTITASPIVSDGVRFDGIAGSTGTFSAWMKMAQMTLQSAVAPTMTTAGDLAYDSTDGNYVGYNTAPFVIGRSSITETVIVSSQTGAGSGGWDSRTIPLGKWTHDRAYTIKSMTVTNYGGTSVTFNIDERASGSLNSAGTNLTTASITSAATGTPVTVFSNASIASGAHLVFKTSTSVSSGAVDFLEINFVWSEDAE